MTTCTDVDECSEGSHTCHPSATCRNTLGGLVLFLDSFFTLGGFVLFLVSFLRWAGLSFSMFPFLHSQGFVASTHELSSIFLDAGTPAPVPPHAPHSYAPPPACLRGKNTWMGEFFEISASHEICFPGLNGETVATFARATQAVWIAPRCRAYAPNRESTPDAVRSARLEPPAPIR